MSTDPVTAQPGAQLSMSDQFIDDLRRTLLIRYVGN